MEYLDFEDLKAFKGKLSDDEYLELLYYNYPSLWLEEHLPDPQNLDKTLKLRSYQTGFINSHSKQRVARYGRQLGKTTIIQLMIIFFGLKVPGSRILVVGPQKTHVELIFDGVLELLNAKEKLKQRYSSKRQPMQIIFKGDSKQQSKALFVTTGEDSGGKGLSIRGKTANVLIVDEADYIGDDTWEKVIKPTTNSFKTPWIFLFSTPTGRRGYFRNSDESGFYKTFHHKASENPAWSPEREAEIRSGCSKLTYEHEYEACYGDAESGLFSKDDMAICEAMSVFPFPNPNQTEGIARQYSSLDDIVVLNDFIKPKIRILGVDWNHAINGTRLVWIDFDTNHNMWIRRKWKIDTAEFTQNVAMSKIIELHAELKFDYVIVDVGYGCVHKDTLITTNMSIKRIEELDIGDLLLTHDGTYQRVLKKWKVPAKRSNVIKITKCMPITTSHCHPFLTYIPPTKFKYIARINEEQLAWVAAEKLKKGDFVAIPKEKHIHIEPIIDLVELLAGLPYLDHDSTHIWSTRSNDPHTKISSILISKKLGVSTAELSRTRHKLRNNIQLNAFQQNINAKCCKLYGKSWWKPKYLKFARYIDISDFRLQNILGWYLSEGNANLCAIEIWQKKTKYMTEFMRMCNYAKQLFPSVTLSRRKDDKIWRLTITGKIITEFFKIMCGALSHQKRMDNRLYWNITPYLLAGVFRGDGHNRHNKELQLSLTSLDLIMQIRQYFINHNILPSMYERSARKQNHRIQYYLSISGNNKERQIIHTLTNMDIRIDINERQRREYILTRHYILVPVCQNTTIGECNDLYDITIENTNSFTGNGVCLHNSTQIEDLHIYGKMHPETRLDKIVIGVETQSQIEIVDIATGKPRKTYIKNFMVESMVRFMEQHRVRIPSEENLAKDKKSIRVHSIFDQMNEYVIDRITTSGRPVYTTVGDISHDLDATMFGLYGYLTQVIKTQNLFQKLPPPRISVISHDKIMARRAGLKVDENSDKQDIANKKPILSGPSPYNLTQYAHRSLRLIGKGRFGNTNKPGISRRFR